MYQTSYQATSKQNGYYKNLTGEWLPRGTSKSQASRLIEKALKGEIVKKADRIEVNGYSFFNPGHIHHQKVFYRVCKNYRDEKSGFDTFEAALKWAKAFFDGQEIIESPNTVAQYCAD